MLALGDQVIECVLFLLSHNILPGSTPLLRTLLKRA